jgi:hypothetical protein
MDNVCRNWSEGMDLGATDPGFARLDTLYGLILRQNREGIQDPLRITNNGVAAEFGTAQKLRKNYAFYEGYSRMDVDFDTITYETGEYPGVGLMVRASDNIEIYAARADTNNMFDTAFIAGAGKTRYIFPATDSAVNNFRLESEGIWVKGLDPQIDEKVWWVGLDAVRLPFTAGGGVVVGEAFTVGEKQLAGEPAGTLVGGPERSVFRMMPILEDAEGNEQIINNAADPEILIHGNRRRFVFDTTCMKANVDYRLEGVDADSKVIFTENGYEATLEDTAVFNSITAILNLYVNSILVAQFDKNSSSGRICLKNADLSGAVEVLCNGAAPVAVTLENDESVWAKPRRFKKGKVIISWERGAKAFKSSSLSDEDLLWPPKERKSELAGAFVYPQWKDFRDSVLAKFAAIHVVSNKPGKSVLKIVFMPDSKDESAFLEEKVRIIQPRLDIEDKGGLSILNRAWAFDAKKDSPATAKVLAHESESDFISTISLRFEYDMHNENHIHFYGANQPVRSIEREYASARTIYALEWDGRDGMDNRILLGGAYKAVAEIQTHRGNSVTISERVEISEPRFLSFGVDYPISSLAAHDIDLMQRWSNDGLLNWSAVPFLNTPAFRSFSWLSNFASAQNIAIDLNGYNTISLDGRSGSETFIDELKSSAGLRLMAHHGLTTGGTMTGATFLRDGSVNQRLLASCPQHALICGECQDGVCDTNNTHCMNITCDGTNRENKYLDDVLFAALLGCRTDEGDYSTAQAYLDHGVDIVLATKKKVPVLFIVLYNRYLQNSLGKRNRSVSQASADAYNQTIATLIGFLNNVKNFDELNAQFGLVDGQPFLDTHGNMISIHGAPAMSVLPARYGAASE